MSEDDTAIRVSNVSKSFKLPHDKQSSLKGGLISLVKNGRRTYEKQEVLKNVSFEIKKGDFFGIVGRNGSGKSTLLKILAGIYTPTTGSVEVNGSLTPFIELGVGFNPELSGRENVYLNGALLGFNRSEMEVMYDDIVEFAELERFMDQKLKNYSSGMQVRLAFSIAIRAKSDILLIDEVLAVGDAAFQQKCYTYFEHLREEEKTVVLVTHDMSAVERFCSSAMLINNMMIVAHGEPGVVADAYREENITTPKETKTGNNHKYDISIDISDQNNAIKKISFKHNYAKPKDVYLGLMILKDGVNVAEINSSVQHLTNSSIAYNLDTNLLNPGIYYVSAALFVKKTRALIAMSSDKKPFVVQGADSTRGGPVKMGHNWASSKK